MTGRRWPLLWVALVASAGCGQSELELGERIYLQGRGEGARLDYRQGPTWLARAGQGCAVCHGVEGQGRVVQAGTLTGAAPALTSDVLKARGYDKQSLRRAIVDGLDPSGRQLSYYMPRWVLSDREMLALQGFLETL
ncbi:MAG TPA: cytochrome c [Gammaproteobacteria bacterium]|nr:cytochrome c [Gammaproteobacteria bacterium]HPQ25802.1 cytochrome c [Gammaproteobacteria bacterium]